jgi:chemotaxis signal transduction protein
VTAIETTAEREQYLSFRIGEEEYAVGILRVREILRYEAVTRVPTAPPWVRGVINLRGSVVPVMDLAVRFGRSPAPPTKWTCIVIVEVRRGTEVLVTGIVADEVRQVLDLGPEDIEPPPGFGVGAAREYLVGMGRTGRQFVLILDVDQTFGAADVARAAEQVVDESRRAEAAPGGEVRDPDAGAQAGDGPAASEAR